MIYLDLFIGFLKVGCFSFGGAYSAIPLIRDIVRSYGWLNDDMITNMVAVSESTPGPIMVNLATYVGSTQAGILGAAVATAAVVLPAFFIILLITALLKRALKNKYVQAAIGGLKPCIMGIILATGCSMIVQHCFTQTSGFPMDIRASVITLFLTLIYFGSRKIGKKGLSPILLILLSACCGIIAYSI